MSCIHPSPNSEFKQKELTSITIHLDPTEFKKIAAFSPSSESTMVKAQVKTESCYRRMIKFS